MKLSQDQHFEKRQEFMVQQAPMVDIWQLPKSVIVTIIMVPNCARYLTGNGTGDAKVKQQKCHYCVRTVVNIETNRACACLAESNAVQIRLPRCRQLKHPRGGPRECCSDLVNPDKRIAGTELQHVRLHRRLILPKMPKKPELHSLQLVSSEHS